MKHIITGRSVMFRVNVKSMAVLSIMILTAFSLNAQEFEIAVGTDSTFCSGAAFGGELPFKIETGGGFK